MHRPRIDRCDGVYEPREDSFLLMDAVERYAYGRALDVGTGSGVQGICAALMGCKVTFVDIDARALECARGNAELNGVDGEFILSNMFDKVEGRYDTIIFNPPYVPTDSVDDLTTDGGRSGREAIDRFLGEFRRYVSEDYVVLMIESSLNNYERDVEMFGADVVCERELQGERIVVLRFGSGRQHIGGVRL